MAKETEWSFIRTVIEFIDKLNSLKFWVSLALIVLPFALHKLEINMDSELLKYVYITGWGYVLVRLVQDVVTVTRK